MAKPGALATRPLVSTSLRTRATQVPASVGRRRVGVVALAMLLVCALGLGLASATARADSQDERRVRTGARLFRSLLAADVAVERKARRGVLDVAVYAPAEDQADLVVPVIAPDGEAGKVRGLNLELRRIDAPDEANPPMSVFLAAPLPAPELAALIDWSRRHKVLLYSPFEGDVERGVMAGLSIEAKVLPFVNSRALAAGGVELKPFFLKVAKVHP